MSPDKPLLTPMCVDDEIAILGKLWAECETFLVKWKAYEYTSEDAPADAIVAIFTLQNDITTRREWLFSRFVHEEIPF